MDLLELVKYFAASLVALIVDVGILVLLASWLHVYYLLAALISFLAGIAVIYFLSIRYVFESRPLSTSKGKEFLFFLLIGGVGLFINEFILWLCTSFFGVHYLVSKVISVFFVFGWNYVARKKLLFSIALQK